MSWRLYGSNLKVCNWWQGLLLINVSELQSGEAMHAMILFCWLELELEFYDHYMEHASLNQPMHMESVLYWTNTSSEGAFINGHL